MPGFDDLTTMRVTIDDNGLARIVFTEGARGNPIGTAFCSDLKAVTARLSTMPDLRAVLISAEGRMFSVGGDIKSLVKDQADVPYLVMRWTADLHNAIARLMRMRAPVIAAVHGNVAGGSVSLVAACDIVYAAEPANFTAAFPAIGFSADSGSTVTVSQRMGFSRAKRFLMLSETLSARDAQATGLVDVVTSPDALMAEAEATAKKLASGATLAYAGIKQTMMRARTQGLEAQMEDEAQTLGLISGSNDAWEGLSAFAGKRKPVFRGR